MYDSRYIELEKLMNIINKLNKELQLVKKDINNKESKSKELVSYIEQKIKGLKDIDMKIVNLFYYSSVSIKDIAKKLNISELNVKTRLHRIRKKIKKELNNGGI